MLIIRVQARSLAGAAWLVAFQRSHRVLDAPLGLALLTGDGLRGMTEDIRPGDETAEPEPPAFPRHLSALIGALRGPPDLGRNHDKYLTYSDRKEAGGAASA
jgi:hypothetical protein